MENFWEKYPALLFGLFLFLGSLFALQSPWALLPAFILCFTIEKKLFAAAVCTFLLPLPLLAHFYTFPPSETEVEGRFHIQHLRETSRYSKGWLYRGILKTDQGKILCQIYSKELYRADQDYIIDGHLRTRDGRFYTIKPKNWREIERGWSLAQWRFLAKEKVKKYIRKHIPFKRASEFLTGMATGQLEDRSMQGEFGHLGLSHIMAISGFHFVLLTLAFHSFLRLFLPYKVEAALLLSILTLYFLFIGDCPSVQRAWIFAIVLLLGQLFEKQSIPLNSLGVALLIASLLNPLSTTTLSFQLSFLATAGILCLYTPVDRWLQLWLPKASFIEVIEKNKLWQWGYIGVAMFREAFALTLAVHIALVPLLLFYFHNFSLNGLFYNLFFPFFASIGLLLLMCSVILGPWLHHLNGWYCETILKLVESPPIEFKSLEVGPIPAWVLTGYYVIFLLGAIYLHKKNHVIKGR